MLLKEAPPSTPAAQKQPGAWTFRSPKWIESFRKVPSAFAVLLLTLILTGIAWRYAALKVEQDARAIFEREIFEAREGISRRIQAYVDILLGARGLFASQETVTRADWKRYVASLDIQRRYPGVRDIVFVRYVPRHEKENFEKRVRTDTSLTPEGYPDFSIYPPSERDAYYPIEYVEPSSPMPPQFGFDVGSDLTRLAALERARDTGEPTATGKITPFPQKAVGFAIRVPVYRAGLPHETVAERRAGLLGLVAASFDMNELMQDIQAEARKNDLRLEIFDGGIGTDENSVPRLTEDWLLYNSPVQEASAQNNLRRRHMVTLNVAGRNWHLIFSVRHSFGSGLQEKLPLLVLLAGSAISFAAFTLTWSTATARRRAVALAETMITERQEREERFGAIFDGALFGIGVVSLEGRFIQVNQGFADLLGYTRKELEGKTFQEITHPDDLAASLSLKDAFMEGRLDKFRYEKRYFRKDGQLVWAHLTISVIHDTAGKPKYFVAVADDITRRKQADEKLRRNEAQLAKAQEIAHLGSWEMDLTNGAISWSNELYRIYGLAPQSIELTYEKILGYTHPDDREQVRQAVSHATETLQPLRCDYRIIRPDRSVRTIHAEGETVSDKSGKAIRMVGTAQDITERKQAEEALRETNEALQALIEASPLAIITLDLEGRVKTWNPASKQIFGWNAEEVIGRFNPIVPKEKEAEFKTMVDALLKGKSFLGVEVCRQKKDGSRVELTLSTAPLRDAQGNIQGIMGILADMTEHKRAQEALRRSERRFRQVVESNMIGIVFSNVNGHITEANDAFLRMVGETREEVYSRKINWREMTPAEYAPLDLKALDEMAATGVCTPFEKEFVLKDGRRIPVMIGAAFLEGSHQETVAFILDIADRKRADRLLRQSEEQYRLLFEGNPHPMWIFDVRTLCFLAVNGAAVHHYGYTREEFLSMTITDLRPAEETSLLPDGLQEVASVQNNAGAGIWKHRKKDGTIIDVAITFQNVLFMGKEARVVLADDVTERLRDAEAVKQSEAYLRAIIDSEPECVKTLSIDGTLLAVNPAGLAMVQAKSDEEVIGANAIDIVHPEDRGAFQVLHRSASGGASVSAQYRIIGLKGRVRWVEAHSVPLKDKQGNIHSVLAVSRDITDQKEAVQALRQSEEQYRILFDRNPHPMWVTDPDTNAFLAVNEEAVRHYGYTREEFLQMTIFDIRPGGEVPKLREHLRDAPQRYIKPNPVRAGIWTHMKKDGTLMEMQITWNLIFFRGKDARLVMAEDVTESRKIERELQRSERRFRQLAENIHEVFWVAEREPLRAVYISPAYEQIWGRSCQSLYDDPHGFIEAVHPEDRNYLFDSWERHIRGEQTDIEYRIIRPDGAVRWIRDCGFPIKDESGGFNRIAGVAEDITERRQAQEALRETNDALRTLIHASPLAIFALDPEGRVKIWNPAAERIFGWNEGEILDQTFSILSEDPEEERTLLQRFIAEGKEVTGIELRRRRKDGRSIDLSLSVAPLPAGGGLATIGLVAVAADISDRKKAEEAFRKSNERLNLVTRATNDAVWDWDLMTDGLWWNENLQTLFDYKPKEIGPGVDWWADRLHPEDRDRVLSSVNAAIEGGEQFWVGEYRFRRGGGAYASVFDRGYIVRDTAGVPVRMIGAIMDITERKQAEERLKRSEGQLAAAQEIARLGSWVWDLPTGQVTWSDEHYRIFGLRPQERKITYDIFLQFIHREDVDRISRIVKEGLLEPQPFSYDFRVIRPDGTVRIVHSRGEVLCNANRSPLQMIGTVQDVTEQRQAEEALRVKTEQLGAVTNALTAYLDRGDWTETSAQILRSVIQQTESQYGFIGVVVEGPALRILAVEGIEETTRNRPFYIELHRTDQKQGYLELNRFDNLFGKVIQTGNIVLSNDIASDPRSAGIPPGHPALHTFLGVPIIRENEVVGMIGIANRPGGYSGKEQAGLEILSHATGILYDSYRRRERENALEKQRRTVERELRRSQRELRNLSSRLHSMVEEERTRISREIHDELGQQLTILKMELSWLGKQLPEALDLLRKRTKSMTKLVDRTIHSVRRISTELRPGVLDDLGLTAAIEWQVQEFQTRTKLHCLLSVRPEEITLDPERSTTVFRILQEALTNIVRHAHASEVKISLEKNKEELILEIGDNGRGIAEDQISHTKSLGLLGMRERALLWGGAVQIRGVPGRGTTVTVRIPLERPGGLVRR